MYRLLVCLSFLSLSFNLVAFEKFPKVVHPKNNQPSAGKIELGKKLFFDPRLSFDGTVSCNSCHNIMAGGDDDRMVSGGVKGQRGGRNSPTVWNSAFHSVQFWDGRAASLEDQAKGPLINPIEMGNPNHDVVINRLRNIEAYVLEFNKVFGGKGKASVTIDHVAMAIASFERTLITPNSAVDRFLKGEKRALSPLAKKGMKLVEEIGCTGCHMGPNYNGPEMPVGQGFYQKFPMYPGSEFEKKYDLVKDLGRFEVTKDPEDKNHFRVPTWRNVALTAPYFHNGKVATLEEAVRVMAKMQLDKNLKPAEVDAIVAFLESLTGEFPRIIMPRLPEVKRTSLVTEQN